MIRVIDLFCGCGGLSLGLQQAGFDVVAGFDNWQKALDIYEHNLRHDTINMDLANVDDVVKQIKTYKVDMIAGGPPCQDFSHAGKRDEDNGKGDLTVSFAEIIEKVRPQIFLMENVDRITKTSKFATAFKIFKKAGYGVTIKTLDASFYGVPQRRKRCFVVGILGEQDNYLDTYLLALSRAKNMTIREYLGNKLGIEHYYRHPRNYSRRGVFSIDEASPTVRGVNRPLPKGYPGHIGDTSKNYTNIRPLTTIERSYIQTFPDKFEFFGSKTELEQMIGNAVPVNLAKAVGTAIITFLDGVYSTETNKNVTIFEQCNNMSLNFDVT
jgi:DNA (cytosine-5)-methyltransferase 1